MADPTTAEVEKRFRALCQQVCEAEGWRIADGGAMEVQLGESGSWRSVGVECQEFGDEVLARIWTDLGPPSPNPTTTRPK